MTTFKSKFSDVAIPAMSLADYTMEHFDCYGDKVAMVDGIKGHSYTYGQMKVLVQKIHFGLTARGFKEGDVFGFFGPNSPEYALVLLGVLSAGGVVTGVNPSYTLDELLHPMKDSEATFLITTPPLAEQALKAKDQLPNLKEVFVFGDHPGCTPYLSLLDNSGKNPPRSKVNLDDVVLLPYSSGTTGLPKGVMLTHRTVVSNMCQSIPLMELQRGTDCVLMLLPMFHVYGLCAILMDSLREGLKLITLPKFKPDNFLQTIQDYKVTVAHLVPPLMVFLAKSPLVDQYDLSSLQKIVCGAAPLSCDIMEAIGARLGIRHLLQGYGLTETSPVVTIALPNTVYNGSSGVLIPQTEMKIVDTTKGKLLGPGQDGEIWLRGPQIMKGYLKNPEATAHCIDKDGFFHTGDIGHIDEDGALWIVDRLKELIKYKGFQVAPAELEALLLTHPEVLDAAVIGVPDKAAGEVPRAFIVRKNADLTAKTIGKFVSDKAAPHKALRGGVVFVEQIPKSPSGKILRRELRKSLKP